jgi:CubicO group peptidase (beta-lactamase class C family)
MQFRRLCFVLILLALMGGILPVMAQEDQSVYEDPDGRFSLPLPTNWTAEPGEGFVTISDPDGKILVYALVAEGDDIAQAIDEAWKIAAPDFEFAPQQTQEVPSSPSVDATLIMNQVNEDQTRIYQGYGQRVGGEIYILLIDADVVAATERSSQLQVAVSGFTINSVEKIDLTGVKPLALTGELVDQFERYIQDMLEELEIPGAAVAVVQDGEIVYSKGFGVRELGKDDPVTPETLMMIGSTTKSMTTMMMATLVDDGKMDWDQPVIDILPDFAVADPELTRTITVRNLVCACTGVPRRDLEWVFNSLTPEEIIASLSTFRFFTDFGEAFQYSNQMVATGGYVAATAAGGSGAVYDVYREAMQTRVFDPIGMPETTFSFDDVATHPNHATPHGAALLGEFVVMPLDSEKGLIPIGPAGAAWSNVDDMARYLITEINRGVSPDGKQVVTAENLEETWQPQVSISADVSYGLGWMVDSYKGLKVIAHDGLTFGFTTDLAFLPDVDLGIVVLTNGRLTSLFNQAVRFRLLELLFEQEPEFQATLDYALKSIDEQLAEADKKLVNSIDAEAVKPYVDTFSNAALGDITISFDDDKLTLDVGEFTSELRGYTNDQGEIVYVSYDPPVAGLPFAFKEEAGEPVIVLDIVTDQYTFTPSGS